VQPGNGIVCPDLELIINISYGNPSLFISNSFVPSITEYNWRKIFYNLDRMKICNTDPLFTLGLIIH
jgi:hypothetical protein